MWGGSIGWSGGSAPPPIIQRHRVVFGCCVLEESLQDGQVAIWCWFQAFYKKLKKQSTKGGTGKKQSMWGCHHCTATSSGWYLETVKVFWQNNQPAGSGKGPKIMDAVCGIFCKKLKNRLSAIKAMGQKIKTINMRRWHWVHFATRLCRVASGIWGLGKITLQVVTVKKISVRRKHHHPRAQGGIQMPCEQQCHAGFKPLTKNLKNNQPKAVAS